MKDRLKKIRGILGKSQRDMAKLIHISYQAWQGYEQGANKPGSEVLKSLAKLGFNINWILTGEGPMYVGGIRNELYEAQPDQNPEFVAETITEYNSVSENEYILVPLMAGRISAGGGLVPDNNVEMLCAFHRKWLMRKGDPKQMQLIRVSGDSMAPTLLHNDLVLVNHAINAIKTIHDGHIYAISIDDEILIKRLYKDFKNNLIEVRSDNPDFKSFSIEPTRITVNGKVIWYAREL